MDFSSQLANLQKSANAAAQGDRSNSNQDRSATRSDKRSSPERHDQGSRPNLDRRRPPPHRYGDNNNNNNNNNRRGNHQDRHNTNSSSNHYRRPPPPHKRQRRDYVEGPYRSPKWNNLKRAVDTLPAFQPPSEPKPCTHLCILAITIDELPFEAIWRDWAQRQSIDISLICHAKEPNKIKSDWLKQRLLVDAPRMGRGNDFAPPTYHTRYPAWGSIEITRAMLDLSHESCRVGTDADMKDPRFSTNRYAITQKNGEAGTPLTRVEKVLFVSETCLPVASLTEDMLSPSVSIVNARDTPNNGFSRQLQFEKIHSLVPKKFKADQWMMLSRVHLDAVLQMLPPNFWECFADCNASDELYFPTALVLLGIADDTKQVVRKRITYADWSMGPKNPATFTEVGDLKKVVAEARKEGCLVARKFDGIELEAWKAVVFPS